MIHIDFQGGAHGNFLEFVCNIMAGVEVASDPFNSLGASHHKKYLNKKVFYSDHYSFDPVPLTFNRVIAVKINTDDLLPLSQISLLRAGNYGYENNVLEINTYNKLNNKHYRWVLDKIIDAFFENQIKKSYDAVKDPSWPAVNNLMDFQQLPDHIQKECMEIHNLELLHIDKEHPDCPRHILREFYQIGFKEPQNSGFIKRQELMQYDEKIDLYTFPFASFYDTHRFLEEIKNIALWAGISYTNHSRVQQLHKKFLEKQPYKDSKIKCDQIVQQLIDNKIHPPTLNLMEEAYVNAMLERQGYECRY